MKKLLKALSDLIPALLVVLGSIVVSYGVTLIFLPAGIIVFGLCMATFGLLMIRGSDGGGGES